MSEPTPTSPPDDNPVVASRSRSFEKYGSTDSIRADLRDRSIRAMLIMASSGVFDFVLRVGSISILARLLPPEQFGVVALVTALTAIAEQFRDLGLSSATVQAADLTHEQVSNLFWINIATGFLFFALTAAAAHQISVFYQDDRLGPITLAIATNFISGAFIVQHQALLGRQLKQTHMAVVRLVSSILSVVLAVLLAMNGYGYWALVWREIARNVFVAAGMWIACPWLPGLPRRNVNTRKLIRFGADLTFAQAALAIVSNLDRLLLGKDTDILGLYRQAQMLLVAPIEQLNAPIWGVSQPALSMLQNSPERYRRYYERLLLIVGIATIPFGLFVAVYAHEITHIVLGPKWVGAEIFMQIFGIVTIIRPVLHTTGLVLVTTGRSGMMLALSVVHSIALGAFMVVGVYWGAAGVAIAHGVATLVLMWPKLHYSFRGSPVTVGSFFRALCPPFVASFVMVGALLTVRAVFPSEGTFMPIIVGSSVAFASYFLSLFLIPQGRAAIVKLWQDAIFAIRGAPANPPVEGQSGA